MTDQTPVETDEQDEQDTTPYEFNPELKRVTFQMILTAYDVGSLREGLEVAALNVGRYGISTFLITARDPDSGEEFVIQDGERIYPMDVWEQAAQEMNDPALEQAVDNMVAARLEGVDDDEATQ